MVSSLLPMLIERIVLLTTNSIPIAILLHVHSSYSRFFQSNWGAILECMHGYPCDFKTAPSKGLTSSVIITAILTLGCLQDDLIDL